MRVGVCEFLCVDPLGSQSLIKVTQGPRGSHNSCGECINLPLFKLEKSLSADPHLQCNFMHHKIERLNCLWKLRKWKHEEKKKALRDGNLVCSKRFQRR